MKPQRGRLFAGTASLDEVLITEELFSRPARHPNYEAENRALVNLARAMADSPQDILQKLAETALDLCDAETAGISLLELSDSGEEIFRWRALAGTHGDQLGGTTPRGFSPCGTVLDRLSPQLFFEPARHFLYLAESFSSIRECLLIPFCVGRTPVGTIWAMTHHGGRTLDREDLRILTRLSEFAAAALQVLSALDAAHRQIAERRRIEDVLEARVRQQAAVAELGRCALTGIDLDALMDEVTAIVASGLVVEYSNIFELLPDGTNLLLRAGTGWADGLVGQATLSAEGCTPASHALLVREPVIIDDLRTETRFRDSVLLRARGIISGVSTVIQGQARPYGALGAFTTQERRFTQEDVYFLQAVANMLAMAIDRKRHEQAQRERDLIRTDQMATVGQVAAGVAHELQEPAHLDQGPGAGQPRARRGRAACRPRTSASSNRRSAGWSGPSRRSSISPDRPRPERRRMNLILLIEQTLTLIRGRIEKQRCRVAIPPAARPRRWWKGMGINSSNCC